MLASRYSVLVVTCLPSKLFWASLMRIVWSLYVQTINFVHDKNSFLDFCFLDTDTIWVYKEGCYINWSWSNSCWDRPEEWTRGTIFGSSNISVASRVQMAILIASYFAVLGSWPFASGERSSTSPGIRSYSWMDLNIHIQSLKQGHDLCSTITRLRKQSHGGTFTQH